MIAALLPLAEASLPWSRSLLAVWLALTALQWLVAAPLFAPEGPLALRELVALGGNRVIRGLRRRLSIGAIRTGCAVQLLLALLLLLAASQSLVIAALTVVLAWQLLFLVLTGDHHADGSDKMGLIVTAATLVTAIGVAIGDGGVALAGLMLAGGQLVISYAVAGWCKLVQRDWRDGSALAAILSSHSWGQPALAPLLRRRPVAGAIAWGVMLVEALFPLALLLPAPGLLAALAVMLAFHIATALMMGLNRFPWAFAAAYPAVIALGALLHAAR